MDELIQNLTDHVDRELRGLSRAQYIDVLESIADNLTTFAAASREDERAGR